MDLRGIVLARKTPWAERFDECGRRTGWIPRKLLKQDENGLPDIEDFYGLVAQHESPSAELPPLHEQQNESIEAPIQTEFPGLSDWSPIALADEHLDEPNTAPRVSDYFEQQASRAASASGTASEEQQQQQPKEPQAKRNVGMTNRPTIDEVRETRRREREVERNENERSGKEQRKQKPAPLQQFLRSSHPAAFDPNMDWVNYNPTLQRHDSVRSDVTRLRLRPVAFWLGEKPLYKPRDPKGPEPNIPIVEAYGYDPQFGPPAPTVRKRRKP